MKKILALTSIRSDYDLMSGLYALLHQDSDIELKLLVSGTHLSGTYGNTVEQIIQDGYPILLQIESLINSDSQKSRLKSASILLQNSIDVVAAWQPDLILYAGDREDVLIGAMLGAFLNIPGMHFFGGDHEADGHTDTVIRHATSKLSTFHVVSLEQHRQRLMKMGESSDRICVAGSIALDKFIRQSQLPAVNPASVFPPEKNLTDYAMVIYHPVDAEKAQAGEHFEQLLQALKQANIPAMISYPNSDPGNYAILEKIRQYEHDPQFWFYTNLERNTFISLYKQARFLIGNSSSGILEAASLGKGVINVGLRQRGRYCLDNVIFCGNQREHIDAAIAQLLTPEFQTALTTIQNPYGNGQSCQQVLQLIKHTDFARLLKKTEDPLEMP